MFRRPHLQRKSTPSCVLQRFEKEEIGRNLFRIFIYIQECAFIILLATVGSVFSSVSFRSVTIFDFLVGRRNWERWRLFLSAASREIPTTLRDDEEGAFRSFLPRYDSLAFCTGGVTSAVTHLSRVSLHTVMTVKKWRTEAYKVSLTF